MAFLRKITIKISSTLYEIISDKARDLNLYTYELHSESKAYAVFLGEADIPSEGTLWKELLIFFMNTKETSGYLEFLRSIDPLNFDPELVEDYLECFQRNSPSMGVLEELEWHYDEMEEGKSERRQQLELIGSAGVYFGHSEDDDTV
ncbi:MAG: hypothetical protein AAF720_01490 [Pseudomonadota bacterium]